jgi:hypothetical protein
VLHQDVYPGPLSSSPGAPALSGASLFFPADGAGTGREPWVMASMAASVPYGVACTGTGGIAPRISGVGAPTIGNAGYAVQVSQAFPNSSGVMVLGFSSVDVPLGGGCSLYVNLAPVFLQFPVATNGSGTGAVALPVPAAPVLAGTALYAQIAVIDPLGSFAGLSFTSGLRIVLYHN